MGEIRLVPVLFTDVEGSTRSWEDHPAAMSDVLAVHDRVMREAISSHGGEVFSTAGDSFAARFPSAGAALEAAIDAQIGIRELTVRDEPLRVRMALHAGEVEARDRGWFGPALNQCARLRDAGHGGQVLVSAVAEQLLDGRLPDGVSLEDLGEHRLRDLSRPQRVFQVCREGLPGGFGPLRSLGASNLPIQVTSFVGRVQESAESEKLIRGSRLVTVVGAGGCGKSRLATQVAGRMAGEFPDGVWLVELAALADPGLLAATAAAAVGARQQPGRDVMDSLIGFLCDRSLLLILDNCEHLIEAAADLVGHLLSHAPGVRVLATSREPLNVRGETVLRLLPLPVHGPNGVGAGLLRSDAVRLFAERAEAANPRFRLTPENWEAVAGICAQLDGIPLALELAASAVRVMTVDEIQQRLGDRFRLLIGETRGGLDHHRTLEAAIDWSYDLLSVDQQAVFDRLAVFAAPFTAEAAELVCAEDPATASNMWGKIIELADRSVLEIDESSTGTRYRMLEVVRAFATGRLEARSDQAATRVRERHYQFFRSLVERSEDDLATAEAAANWLAQVEDAIADLRQALRWAIEEGRDQLALDLFVGLGEFWNRTGRRSETAHWSQLVPLHSSGATPASRIRALHFAAAHIGGVYDSTVDEAAVARELADEALGLAGETRDPALLARSYLVAGSLVDGEEAARLLEKGMVLARETGDTRQQILIRNYMAHLARWTGLGRRDSLFMEKAKSLYEENLETARHFGDDRWVALTLGFIAGCVTDRDLIAGRAIGDLDRLAEADRLIQQSLAIGLRLNDFYVLNNALGVRALVAYLGGDFETAREVSLEGVALCQRTLGWRYSSGSWLGFSEYALGALISARESFRLNLAVFESPPDSPFAKLTMGKEVWGFGRLLARDGELRPAAVLLAAVEVADSAMVHPVIEQEREQADYRECLDLIEAGLAPGDLEAARHEGAAMSIHQAVHYALSLQDED